MAERSLLNPSQERHLFALLTDVDDGLAQVEALCAGRTSPFARERADVAPEEARLLTSFVAAARARMLEACDRLGVKRPEPTISGRWSIETALHFAGISFTELSPEKMRNYGELAPGAEEELAALTGALDALAGRGVALVRETDALPAAAAAIPGRAGVILREIERLTAHHGLYEVRPPLAVALERAATSTFDVGVFGRVSVGKSSLLNALLKGEVLPVGATPVTAVPVIIERGAPAVEVRFASREVRAVPLDALVSFVTEEGNPENRRDVHSVLVRVPTAPEGMRFLDTPGVGSLSVSGPALAFASLPHCDLGLVLVAAGAPVGQDDIALVRGLHSAGIEAMLLLSKADLLADRDRARAIGYFAAELDRALGPGHGVEVRPVSTRSGNKPLIAALRADALEPAIQEHAFRSASALGKRLARLVALTEEALAGRQTTLAYQIENERLRRTSLAAIESEVDTLPRGSALLLDRAADAVAAAWKRGEDASEGALDALAAGPASSIARLRSVLDEARAAFSSDAPPRLPPVFDPSFMGAMPDLRPPALGRKRLGRWLATRRLAPLSGQVDTALFTYTGRLLAWAKGALAEIARDASRERRTPASERPLATLAAMAHDMEEGKPEPPYVLDVQRFA